MSDFSLTLVLQIKTSKIINDMAKVQQRSEKITAFGGTFFVLDRNNLPELRRRYPNHRLMMSESECGNGSMDWKAGEHTFFLLSDFQYLRGDKALTLRSMFNLLIKSPILFTQNLGFNGQYKQQTTIWRSQMAE